MLSPDEVAIQTNDVVEAVKFERREMLCRLRDLEKLPSVTWHVGIRAMITDLLEHDLRVGKGRGSDE